MKFSGIVKLWWLIQVENFISWWLIQIRSCTGDIAIHISKRMQLLPETLLCKPQGLFQRGSSMNQLCSIHHDFAATRYIPGVCVQWSQSGHNAGKQSVVLRTRYSILWPWYGQFKDRVSQSPQLLSAGCLKVASIAIAARRMKSKKKKKKIFVLFFLFFHFSVLI